MKLRPKVGFMPISHMTFLSEACKKLTDKVFENLQKLNMDLVRTDYVLNEKQAREVAKKLLSQDDVDMIIYYTASWMEAPVVVRAINESHLPAVVWGVPEAITLSLVGAHEVAESLDEMGIEFLFVFGQPDSKKWLRKIEVRARAAAVLKELKRARVGIIGASPTMGMYSATYDHIALRQIIGPEVFHIDTSTLISEADKITDEEAEKAMKTIVESATKVHVAEKTLFKSFKLALALQKLIKKYDLDMVSVKCHPELSQFYGSSACVANSLAIDLGIPVSCEGDVNNAVSMFILQRLTGNPAFFHEYTTLDEKQNIALVNHCGAGATKLATSLKDIGLTTFPEGVAIEEEGGVTGTILDFWVKPGKATIARLGGRNNTYRMHIASAELLAPTEKQKKADKPLGYEGVARGLIKVKNIEQFMNDTIAHHQAMAHGDVREELYELCTLLGIPTIRSE
ncbi:MAG: L-fucose/L-arabinose isomerase family protein [Promethearchaeota archaeon]